MTRVVVDASLASRLLGLGQDLELCDESGNVLGHFSPTTPTPEFREWLRGLDHGLSPEEVREAVTRREGISTDELLATLRDGRP